MDEPLGDETDSDELPETGGQKINEPVWSENEMNTDSSADEDRGILDDLPPEQEGKGSLQVEYKRLKIMHKYAIKRNKRLSTRRRELKQKVNSIIEKFKDVKIKNLNYESVKPMVGNVAQIQELVHQNETLKSTFDQMRKLQKKQIPKLRNTFGNLMSASRAVVRSQKILFEGYKAAFEDPDFDQLSFSVEEEGKEEKNWTADNEEQESEEDILIIDESEDEDIKSFYEKHVTRPSTAASETTTNPESLLSCSLTVDPQAKKTSIEKVTEDLQSDEDEALTGNKEKLPTDNQQTVDNQNEEILHIK